MSSTGEEEGDWTPPPGIHEPYKLVDTLSLEEFNRRADALGFNHRWCCGSKRVPWRVKPSYGNCSHYAMICSVSQLKVISSDHGGFRPCNNFSFPFNKLKALSSYIDPDHPVVLKYLLAQDLVSSDRNNILIIFKDSETLGRNIGVLFNISSNEIFGYYVVNSAAQFEVNAVKQFFIGASQNTISLVVERKYCDKTLFTRQQYEIWSFQRKSPDSIQFDILNVQNSIEAAMRMHGPLFCSIPGHGVDLYCVAFFKDAYRLKNLYGTYFIALLDAERNRYLRVVNPDDAGLRQLDATIREAHIQHLEASPSGDFLAMSFEQFLGHQLLVCLFAVDTLSLIHNIRLPLFMGRQEGFLSAACCANSRVTFSRCSSRISVFSQSNPAVLEAQPKVNIYQLPVTPSLSYFCKAYLLRTLTHVQIAHLPLPQSVKAFLLTLKPQPSEEEYIETNYGLRLL